MIRPVRESVLVFASMEKVSVAESEPDPLSTASQLASEVAVQPQLPAVFVSAVLPEAPADDIVCEVTDSV